jgi:hypothetical protein
MSCGAYDAEDGVSLGRRLGVKGHADSHSASPFRWGRFFEGAVNSVVNRPKKPRRLGRGFFEQACRAGAEGETIGGSMVESALKVGDRVRLIRGRFSTRVSARLYG